MADDDDLDYSETNVCLAQTQAVRKNISLKLKGKGRGRSRRGVRGRRTTPTKKTDSESAPEDDVSNLKETIEKMISPEKPVPDSAGVDEVILKFETPSFSPIDRSFPEPLHQNKKLRWDHKVNLIGEKVINPTIHCCEKCGLPILNYGRMAPCRHVVCYDCAKRAEKVCPKCEEEIVKVEQAPLGSVFVCTFGGARNGPFPCGRTYLSQRDLQAHYNHRHMKTAAITNQVTNNHVISTSEALASAHHIIARDPRDPRGHGHEPSLPMPTVPVGHSQLSHAHPEHGNPADHSRSPALLPNALTVGSPAGQARPYPHSPANYASPIPVSSARPNLITVPIQDDSVSTPGQLSHVQTHGAHYASAPSNPHPHSLLTLQHPPNSYPPPPHAYQHQLPAQPFSQAPPLTTQTFTQRAPPPVVHHHPPPIRAPGGTMYSTPPPSVHHPPPPTYSTPSQGGPPHQLPPPQLFSGAGNYEDSSYMQAWTSGNVPPPTRAQIPPPPAPNHNLGHIPPRGPSDAGYRPSYYQ